MVLSDYRLDRNKKLLQALSTGLFARGAGLLLQVVSLPMAAAALGAGGFALYSMIAAVLAWASLSNMGISQATTIHMAKCFDDKRRIEMLSASFVFVTFVSLTVLLVVSVIFLLTPGLNWLFGDHVSSLSTLYTPLGFSGAIFVAYQMLSVIEAAQLATQRQAYANFYTSIGTLVSAAWLYHLSKESLTVLEVLVAVHLPVIVARFINAIGVFSFFKLKFSDFRFFRFRQVRLLVRDGVSFLLGGAVANLLCHPLPIIMVGIFYDSLVTASFSAVMNAVIILSSFFGLLMSPFRGALPEARARRDSRWIKRMYLLMLAVAFFYSLFPFSVLFFFGEIVFSYWYQNTVSPHSVTLAGAGAYLIVLAFEVVNYNFLASLGEVKLASRWLLVKSLVAVILTLCLIYKGSHHLIFWGMTFVGLCFSVLPLSRKALKTVIVDKRELSTEM